MRASSDALVEIPCLQDNVYAYAVGKLSVWRYLKSKLDVIDYRVLESALI